MRTPNRRRAVSSLSSLPVSASLARPCGASVRSESGSGGDARMRFESLAHLRKRRGPAVADAEDIELMWDSGGGRTGPPGAPQWPAGRKSGKWYNARRKTGTAPHPQKYTSGRPWSNADHQTLSRLGTSRRRGLGTAQKRTAERDPEQTTRPTLSSGLGTAQRSRLDTRKAAHPDLILEIKSWTRVVAFTGARRTGHRVPRGPSARPPPRGEGAPGASA
jgi:hypothetical protein